MGQTESTSSTASGAAPIGEHLDSAYAELKGLARQRLQRERTSHTLQPTALVHEAWLRLARQTRRQVLSRAQFLAAAAGAMRLVLVDHARRRQARKRDGPPSKPLLVRSGLEHDLPDALEVMALHDALERLEALDPALSRLVELRFFGGLDEEECARTLALSTRTVRRHWRVARLWLARELATDRAAAEPDDET